MEGGQHGLRSADATQPSLSRRRPLQTPTAPQEYLLLVLAIANGTATLAHRFEEGADDVSISHARGKASLFLGARGFMFVDVVSCSGGLRGLRKK